MMIIYEENNHNEDHEHENDENNYEEYIIITTDIAIWLYTESARAVSRAQISPKSATILGLSRRHLQSVRIQIESVFPEPPAALRGGRKFIAFLGTFVLRFPKNSFSPVSVPLGKCSTVDHGRSGARFPLSPSRPPASYCPCLASALLSLCSF